MKRLLLALSYSYFFSSIPEKLIEFPLATRARSALKSVHRAGLRPANHYYRHFQRRPTTTRFVWSKRLPAVLERILRFPFLGTSPEVEPPNPAARPLLIVGGIWPDKWIIVSLFSYGTTSKIHCLDYLDHHPLSAEDRPRFPSVLFISFFFNFSLLFIFRFYPFTSLIPALFFHPTAFPSLLWFFLTDFPTNACMCNLATPERTLCNTVLHPYLLYRLSMCYFLPTTILNLKTPI